MNRPTTSNKIDSVIKNLSTNKSPGPDGFTREFCQIFREVLTPILRMQELDCEESWAPKNWCFWTLVLDKTLESPLDSKESQPAHPKANQSWIFLGRTDAETPILWPPDAKSWLIGKDPDAGKEKPGREGDDRGWDGWMASPTRWTWVWVISGSWWWTGKPGMLQSMGLQRVIHDWATDWTE